MVGEYLQALRNGEVGEPSKRLFTSDVQQVEVSNQLNRSGQTSNSAKIIERPLAGKKFISQHLYAINRELVQANFFAVEASWRGVLSESHASMEAGTEIQAEFGMFFEFKDGLISKQHNYVCSKGLVL